MQPKPESTTPPTLRTLQALVPNQHYNWTEYNYALNVFQTEARTYRGPNGRIVAQSFGYYVTAKSPQARRSRWSLGDLLYRGEDPQAAMAALETWRQAQEAKIDKRKAKTAARRAARAEFVNPYQVGQILYSSWGYDQTNIDYYEVIEVRPTTLVIRGLAQEHDRCNMSGGYCWPTPGRYLDDGQVARLTIYANGQHRIVSPDADANLYLWNGEPMYFSDDH